MGVLITTAAVSLISERKGHALYLPHSGFLGPSVIRVRRSVESASFGHLIIYYAPTSIHQGIKKKDVGPIAMVVEKRYTLLCIVERIFVVVYLLLFVRVGDCIYLFIGPEDR